MIDLTDDTLQAALNALDACAYDRREPERYRDWYAGAAEEIRRFIEERRSENLR
jgi:hypothetical protein